MFAGPNHGKSGVAGGLLGIMKSHHMSVDIIAEKAREAILEGSSQVKCQPLMFGTQLHRLERLRGKADYAITDSPLLLSTVYQRDFYPRSFQKAVVEIFKTFDNVNIVLDLPKGAAQTWDNDPGRIHSEVESMSLDFEIKDMLEELGLPFERYTLGPDTAKDIFEDLFK